MLVSRSIKQLVNMTEKIKNAIPNQLYGIGLHGKECILVKSKFLVFLVLNYHVFRITVIYIKL